MCQGPICVILTGYNDLYGHPILEKSKDMVVQTYPSPHS